MRSCQFIDILLSQLLDQPFLPQLLTDGGPLVLAFEEFFPVLLGLFPRNEFVEWSNVEENAIVEVGFQP